MGLARFDYRKQVEREKAQEGYLREVARDIAKRTLQLLDSDRDEGDDLARRYRNTVRSESTPEGARVYTDDPFAAIVEFGAQGTGSGGEGTYPAKAPMRRAARQWGNFEEGSR